MMLEIVTQCHRFKLSKHMDQIFLRITMLQKLSWKMPGETMFEITFPDGLCLIRNACWVQKSLWAQPCQPDRPELFSHKSDQCCYHPAVTNIPWTVRISKDTFVTFSPFLSQLNNLIDGWMASPTRWMWVWVNSGSWWWTGRPGVLRFMGSQRVGHDWASDLIWSDR